MQSRVKGSVQRRPQTRVARQQAAQTSMLDKEKNLDEDAPVSNPSVSGLVLPPPNMSSLDGPTPLNSALPSSSLSQPPPTEISPEPSALTLPVSSNGKKQDFSKNSSSTKVLPPSDEDDLFGSDSLFTATSVTNTPSSTHITKTVQQPASGTETLMKDQDKNDFPSIFDDNIKDLFQKVKPRSTVKKPSSFLEEEEEDDEDIFGVSNNSSPAFTSCEEANTSSSFPKQDIFKVTSYYRCILTLKS